MRCYLLSQEEGKQIAMDYINRQWNRFCKAYVEQWDDDKTLFFMAHFIGLLMLAVCGMLIGGFIALIINFPLVMTIVIFCVVLVGTGAFYAGRAVINRGRSL